MINAYIRRAIALFLCIIAWPTLSQESEIELRDTLIKDNAYKQELEGYQIYGAKATLQSISPSCISSPLPTTPGSPNYQFRVEWTDTKVADVTIWRVPCNHDPNISAVLLRFVPTNQPFICSASFAVAQNGSQYDSVKLVSTPGGSSFCDDLFVSNTLLLDQWTITDNFDDNQAFQLIHDGVYKVSSINIPAYTGDSPPSSDNVKLRLDEPVKGKVHSGIGAIRGYALSAAGIRRVKLYIDGVYKYDIPYGDIRDDMEMKHPGINNSLHSGFVTVFEYNKLTTGDHIVSIRAVAKDGKIKEITRTFGVDHFHKVYFPNKAVSFSSAELKEVNDKIIIENLSVGDKSYTVKLKWRKQTQTFEIIDIK